MRLVLFTILLAGSIWAAAQTPQYNGLVLRDGRLVGCQGRYEIFDDVVEFTDNDGLLTTLPLDKVDLEKTRQFNQHRRERARNTVVIDGTRYVALDDENGSKRGNQPEIIIGDHDRSGADPKEKGEAISLEDLEHMDREKMDRLVEQWQGKLNNGMGITLLGLLILTGLLSLISGLMHWYILFKAFMEDGFLKGMKVIASWMLPFFVMLIPVLLLNSGANQILLGLVYVLGLLVAPIIRDIYCWKVLGELGHPGWISAVFYWGWYPASIALFTMLTLSGIIALTP